MRKIILFAALLWAATVNGQLKSESYITHYGHLDNALYQIKTTRKATVAFLGGSITNMTGWRDEVCKYLADTYPGTQFTFINAGIPSLGSLPHAFRLQRDVLDKGPIDLLFVESAVNDKVNGTNETTQRRALEGIIRHTLTVNAKTSIVLMAFADEDKMADYRAGKTPAEIQVHDDLARKYHLPFINLAKEITNRIDAGEFNWKNDFKDLHPSPFGQHLYFNTIKQLLTDDFTKHAPTHLVKAKLPAAADPFNYSQAGYVDIKQATQLQGFSLDSSWQPADGIGTRDGFVHVPMLVSTLQRASLDFPFTGRTVGIAAVSGPAAGMISYSVDNGPAQTLDLHTAWSDGLYLPWYLVLGDGLSAGKHVLHLQTGPAHSAAFGISKCQIVYFLVNK